GTQFPIEGERMPIPAVAARARLASQSFMRFLQLRRSWRDGKMDSCSKRFAHDYGATSARGVPCMAPNAPGYVTLSGDVSVSQPFPETSADLYRMHGRPSSDCVSQRKCKPAMRTSHACIQVQNARAQNLVPAFLGQRRQDGCSFVLGPIRISSLP